MAKLKTFTNDEILTAQDVNEILNPDVPAEATARSAIFTGGFTSPFTGTFSAVRDGNTVTINGQLGGDLSFTATGLISIIDAGVIPPEFIPASNRWGPAYLSGGTLAVGNAVIGSTGLVRLFKGSATTNTGAQFSITYVLPND